MTSSALRRGLAIALENLFPPLPARSSSRWRAWPPPRGSFTLFEALAWTTAGSVVGAFALYALGAVLGIERLRALVRSDAAAEGR
jgi:membrane protein DedA with SNARE-associated domain